MTGKPAIRVVAVLGPTAAGKTAVSIHLAERLAGEIVSADSRLFYRGMDIGTDKPTPAMRRGVPHHLIDVTDPDSPWSLALFQSHAIAAIEEISAKNRLPFLVGGTGQYLTSVLEGWVPAPVKASPELRQELEAFVETHGSQALHDRLAEIDPPRAKQLDHRNVRRVIRALEIFHFSGRPPSQAQGRVTSPLKALRVGLNLPRSELYARIDARIGEMLQNGLIEEVQSLLDRGYSPGLPAFSAIGYRQIADYLGGRISLEEAEQEMKRLTRRFVRRQANWFKADDPRIHWFESRDGVDQEIDELIRGWLADEA